MKYFSWLFLSIIVFGLTAFSIYNSASKEVAKFNQEYNCDYSTEEWIFTNKTLYESIVNKVEPKTINVWIEIEEE